MKASARVEAVAAALLSEDRDGRLLAASPVLAAEPVPRGALQFGRVWRLTHRHLVSGEEVQSAFKPVGEVFRPGAWSFGHSRLSALAAEGATRLLALRLGPPWDDMVPPAALIVVPGVPGGPGLLAEWRAGAEDDPAVFGDPRHAWVRAALLDYLSGQQDRHAHNFKWDAARARLSLFDHAFSFPVPYAQLNRSVFLRRRLAERPAVEADEGIALRRLGATSGPDLGFGGLLSPRRVAFLRRRLERLAAGTVPDPAGRVPRRWA